MSLRVSRLWIYPVKSCRAVAVEALALDALGAAGDRRFLVTDLAGRLVTQRSHPQMTQIQPVLTADALILRAGNHGEIQVPRNDPFSVRRNVEVWDDRNLQADCCGPEAQDWLSALLGQDVQLVRIGPAYQRRVTQRPADSVSFADAYPLLIISQASLDALNDRLVDRGEEPVPMERFRPNIVVEGAVVPHAEDRWSEITIGSAELSCATPCSRCIMVSTDPWSGERSAEPLRTLATYRRGANKGGEVFFGRNAINTSKSGIIRLGDSVRA
jgi:uncharacterized protein